MIEGDLNPWADSFPEGLVPVILELILTTWPTLSHHEPNEHETAITRRFRVLLRRQQRARRLPFLIDREVTIDDENTSEELGRLDLRFIHGHRDDVYLTFESKRLNVTGKDSKVHRRTSEYVSEGMMRFIEGQYARALREGGMLAYVMDGDCAEAAKALAALIAERCHHLRLLPASGLDECDLRPGDATIRQTRHQLQGRVIRLHHLLLAV